MALWGGLGPFSLQWGLPDEKGHLIKTKQKKAYLDLHKVFWLYSGLMIWPVFFEREGKQRRRRRGGESKEVGDGTGDGGGGWG